jgi:hypothetical protein
MTRREPIYVEIRIAADLDTVWRLTQDTAEHSRWDLRFNRITALPSPDGDLHFEYERRLPLHSIRGTGVSRGERSGPGGERTSALVFRTDDPLSPLRSGRGYWRYVPDGDGVRFLTGYDYDPLPGRLGSALDAVLLRRLVGWMTAWSFDRLRIWAESGVPPERWPVASALAVWRRDRPQASRCRRRPARRHDVMAAAPAALGELA